MVLARPDKTSPRACYSDLRFFENPLLGPWWHLRSHPQSDHSQITVLKSQRKIDIKTPSLYVMGAEDHLFLPSVRKAVSSFTNAQLSVLENSGHVVNVDQPNKFNDRVIRFLKSLD